MPSTVTLDTDAGTLTLDFATADEARALVDEAIERQSFFVLLEQQLPQFERLEVRLEAPGSSAVLDTEVMQVFPGGAGFGTALGLRDWSPEKAEKLKRQLDGRGAEAHESVVSPAFRIREMNPSERFRLALRASRVERQILLRDTSPQVLLGLLSHPRIEDTEVKSIVTSTHASTAILHRVAENKKWMSNPEIQTAVARNPKTPPPTVIKLLPQLRLPDLQVMAKGGARENIRRAALKIYLQRTGQATKSR